MADAHVSRVFLWILLAVIFGIAIRSFLAIPPFFILALFLAGSAALVSGMSGQNRARAICGLVALGCVAGVTRFDIAARRVPDIIPLGGKSAVLRGVVWEDPVFGPQSQTLRMRIAIVNGKEAADSFLLRVVSKKYPAYETGEELVISGNIDDPADDPRYESGNPAWRPTMLFPYIEKTGSANRRPVMHALAGIKHAFSAKIDAALPEPHAAFLRGLLLGERASLPAELVEDFRRTGTSHMVALSGYNITIVGRSLASALLLLSVPFYASFWVACIAMILFVIATGASASAVRAGIIALLALIAHREGRPYQMTNALACAAAAMLLSDPALFRFDAGFQLSFLATMGLAYLSPGVERNVEHMLDRIKKLAGRPLVSRALRDRDVEPALKISLTVKRLFIETLAAQIAVLPLLVYLFGSLSIISPLVNIIALIAVPYAMGAGFLTAIAGFLSSALGSAVGVASWLMLEYIITVIRWFAAFPYATVELGRTGFVAILVVYGAVAWRTYRTRHSNPDHVGMRVS